MDSRVVETVDDPMRTETPDDVATLYSWANLHGAKYRDFSASRREYRAQVRHRAAESLRQRELQAQAEAEVSAAAAERAAKAAQDAAREQDAGDSQTLRVQSLRNAEAAARRAVAERVEASRRAEAAAMAAATAKREEREIAEAHASAQRQALNYAESDIRRRQLAGPQPRTIVPGAAGDPYTPVATSVDLTTGEVYDGSQTARLRAARSSDDSQMLRLGLSRDMVEQQPIPRPKGYRPDDASGIWQVDRVSQRAAGELAVVKEISAASVSSGAGTPGSSITLPETSVGEGASRPELNASALRDRPQPADVPGPAWLYAPTTGSQINPRPRPAGAASSPTYDGGTLQDSRERVAARWFALKGVFEQPGADLPAAQPARQSETRTPLLAVFSLAGGVGKTSLVATLGRALSSKGEKVVLTDTTSHGLLPFYFGARELRPGVIRTFSPPSGSTDAPIYLVSYDVDEKAGDPVAQEAVTQEILRNSLGNHRVVLDLSAGSGWIMKRLANLHPTVLVPVAPDMNSVISLQAVERFFRAVLDSEGRTLQPFYLLNQFDTAVPLHLDVREVFRRQLGERLLPFVIRRSPAVSEALAEGMTVVDYAPDAPVSQDYLEAASWLRSVSAPATAGFRNVRWSER